MLKLPARTSRQQDPLVQGGSPPRHTSGVWSNLLPKGGALVRMSQRYFGIDLDRVVSMSDDELSQYADRAKEMKRLTEVLPILEEHFQTLIEGQIAYEEFNRRVMKQATAAGKKIDAAIVETFLNNREYTLHGNEMSQKVSLGMQRQDNAHQSALNLGQMDFQSALSIAAMKHSQRAREISLKPSIAQKQLELDEIRRNEQGDRRELLKHGSSGTQGRGVGWFRKLWS
jgi:hypothetical protein